MWSLNRFSQYSIGYLHGQQYWKRVYPTSCCHMYTEGQNSLSLRHLSHRVVGTGYNKPRPIGNRSSKHQRRISSAHLLSQEGRKKPNATGKRLPTHKRNSPDTRPTGAGHRAAARHVRIAGQCNKCGETNHVTQNCRHVNAVSCFVCGQKGHKSKHHVNMD